MRLINLKDLNHPGFKKKKLMKANSGEKRAKVFIAILQNSKEFIQAGLGNNSIFAP